MLFVQKGFLCRLYHGMQLLVKYRNSLNTLCWVLTCGVLLWDKSLQELLHTYQPNPGQKQ